MTEDIRTVLGRPFAPTFIVWKPGATTKAGDKCLAMAYADTRAYQERLDEAFGFGWSVSYRDVTAKTTTCELTIVIDGQPVTRCATGEDTDMMSAEARAFKRACSAFGLGRYLYDLPSVWIEYDGQRKRITDAGQKQLNQRYRDWYQRVTQQPESPQDATDAPHGDSQANGSTGSTDTTETAQDAVEAPDNPFGDKADYVEIAPGEWAKRITEHRRKTLHALGTELYADGWEEVRHRNVGRVTNGRTNSSNDLSEGEADKLIAGMLKLKSKRAEKVPA